MAAGKFPGFRRGAWVCAAHAAVLLSVSCDSPAPSQATSVRDSAGIRIVEHSAEALAGLPEWRVAAEPSVTIGGSSDPAEDLNEVVGGYLGPDGTIVVADGSIPEVRVHAPDGSLLRSLGRQGTGPGEFRLITSIWPRGDSTAIYDMSARRLTVLPNDGSPPRTTSLGRSGLLESVQGSADGRLVTTRLDAEALLAVGAAPVRVPELVLVISPDGASTDTILPIAGPEFYQPAESPGWAGPAPVGLGPVTRFLVLGDSIVIGTGESYELTTHDLAGTPVRIIRVAAAPRPVEKRDIELARQEAWEEFEPRAGNMPAEIVSQYRAFIDGQRYAAEFPFVGRLAADPAGNLWVQDFPRPADGEESFTVFGPDGALVARVRLPSGLHFLAAGTEAILGLWRDADGVEQLRVHRLTRDSEPGGAGRD